MLPRSENGRTLLLLEDPSYDDSLVNRFLRSLDLGVDFKEAFEGDNRFKDLIQEMLMSMHPEKANRKISVMVRKWFEDNRKKINCG